MKSKRVVAIIEARINSKRLVGKVLKKLNGKEIIKIILERLKFSKKIDTKLVATSKNKKDDKLVNLLKGKYSYYRGSEKNVLRRVIEAGEKSNADIIVRLTGDNPLVDPFMIDFMIKYMLRNPKIDYLTNNSFGILKKRQIAFGLDVSIFKLKKLKILEKRVKKLHKKKEFFEFPTLYFYTIGKKFFNVKNIIIPKKFIINKNYRLTLDTQRDYVFFKKLFSNFKKKDFVKNIDVKKILSNNPELSNYNKSVKQYDPNLNFLRNKT